MKTAMYRHENGLKHINIINNEGFSALFVVKTPIFDNSGVAHGVEHGVFRCSSSFPYPETLFQLTSLTDAKINASTFADSTYFHCQSQCEDTFNLAIEYLLSGLFLPIFDKEYLSCEVYDGDSKDNDKGKGVIYRELIGIEQASKASAKSDESDNSEENDTKEEFNYGGVSSTIGELTLKEITAFHQRFYQASNMTLVTANADIVKVSRLISLLPVPTTIPLLAAAT
jgi:Zn-dependent M16 (insulinase) family peptidase